jgi:hypothetical protein
MNILINGRQNEILKEFSFGLLKQFLKQTF